MNELALSFTYSGSIIELEKTSFRLHGMDTEIVAVRGKTAGANGDSGTFQWTPGVKALCVLFMRVLFMRVLSRRLRGTGVTGPLITGGKSSVAASLDYALDKEPQWICDMFGVDKRGKNQLRRLILRTNPGRKRPGPVSLGLNGDALDAKDITILVDSSPIHDPNFLDQLTALILEEPEDYKDAAELMMMHLINDRRSSFYRAQMTWSLAG